MSIYDHALLTNTCVNCYLSVAFGVDPVILPKQCIVGTGINLNSIFSYVSKWLRNKNNFILTLLVLVYSESSLTLLVLVYSESSLTLLVLVYNESSLTLLVLVYSESQFNC